VKRPYIPLGYTKQGRLRPTFLDRPQAHLMAARDSKSAADYACAVERYDSADDMAWVVDALLLIILMASVVGLAMCWL